MDVAAGEPKFKLEYFENEQNVPLEPDDVSVSLIETYYHYGEAFFTVPLPDNGVIMCIVNDTRGTYTLNRTVACIGMCFKIINVHSCSIYFMKCGCP